MDFQEKRKWQFEEKEKRWRQGEISEGIQCEIVGHLEEERGGALGGGGHLEEERSGG